MAVATNLSLYEIERNKPMPNFVHGVLQSKISRLLGNQYEDKFLFPNELSLATTPSSTPDICIYPKRKLSVINLEAKEAEAPITTIEIQSPSQSIDELINKTHNLYFPMGVKSAWIVIPALKAIQVIFPKKEHLLFTTGELKDPTTKIVLNIDKVFEDLV